MTRDSTQCQCQDENFFEIAKLNWQIESELKCAWVVLLQEKPNVELGSLYEDLMSQGQFKLAHHALIRLGEADEQLPDFHQHLTVAAKLMRLENDS